MIYKKINDKISTILLFFLLITGVVITVWGLTQLDWNKSLPFNNTSTLYQYLAFIFFTALSVILGLKFTNRDTFQVGVLLCLTISIFTGTLWPLIVVTWFAFSSIILGQGILSFFRVIHEEISWVIKFLIGAGAYGTLVGLIAHYPVNTQGVYGVALAIPIVMQWQTFLKMCTGLRFWFVGRLTKNAQTKWLDLSIIVVALIHYTVGLMPELSHDALAMHLFIPSHLASNHQWGFDVNTYVWAVMPILADWIFSIGYMLGGETAARMINVGFIFILCKLLYDLVIWAGGNKVGAKWAILIFISTPLTFTESSALYIESIWTSFVVGGTLAVLYISRNRDNLSQYLPIGGLLLGYALATKIITVTILPVLLFVLAIRYKIWLRIESRYSLVLGLCLFLLFGSIPYLTSLYITGSPVFPFYNNLFKSPYYPLEAFNNPLYNSGLSWETLFQITFNTSKYLESGPGAPGFHWLVLFLPSVFMLFVNQNLKGVVILFIGVLTAVIVFQFQSYLRYIFPTFVLLTIVIGLFFSQISVMPIFKKQIIYMVSGVIISINIIFISTGAMYTDFPLYSIYSESSRKDYLENRLPIRNAVKFVNRFNNKKVAVPIFSYALAAGLNADALYSSWYNHKFQALVNSANTDRAMADMLKSKGVESIILDERWGGADKRLVIKNVTEEIASFGKGAISVRVLRREYKKLYNVQHELLKNPDFSSSDGWTIPDGAAINSNGELIVNVESPVSQVVPVQPHYPYVKTTKTKCYKQPTQGRLQVNWLDSRSKLISVDIRVFDCTELLTEQSIDVIAPPNAALAVIYAASHTNKPIVYKEVHFYHD